MKQSLQTLRIPRRIPLLVLVSLTVVSCFRCPESQTDALLKRIPSPESKNEGVDLKGWVYEKIVSAAGQPHYYYRFPSDTPDKPTLVLLHGLIFDGKNFLEFKPLASHFNLIAYDLPNESAFYRGQSDDFAALLTDFLTAMKLEKIYLGGVSLGGQIALSYAAKPRPVELMGLILISTDASKTDRELRKAKRVVRTTERITNREAGKTLCVVDKLVKKKQAEAGEKLESLDNFVIRKVDFYNQVLDTTKAMEAPLPLKSITAPTLIIHGDADSVVSIDDARGLVDAIPNAKFVTIHGGEHAIAYSHPDEIIRNIEARFGFGN